jgi:transposase
MPRYLALTPHLTAAELLDHYRHSTDPVARSHYQILWLVSTGQRCPQVAAATGYSADWIRQLVGRYNDGGPDAVGDGRHFNPGHAPLLDPAGMAALQEALTGPAPDGGLWSGPKVARWMAARLKRPVSNYRGWAVLRRAGYTRQVPRPHATTADPAAQEAFKKGGSAKRWTRSAPPTPTR